MKILILDPYASVPYRISKDTSGGYGTGNDFGDGFVARTLRWLLARGMDWPPLSAVYAAGTLRSKGHDVSYARVPPRVRDYDVCFVTSSIVCHETELRAVRAVRQLGIPVGVIGPFATSVPQPYIDAGAFVVKGEPEMYFMAVDLRPETVAMLEGVVETSQTADLDDLPLPAWDLVFDVARPRFGLLGSSTVLPILATRGCPYSCSHYCVYPLQQGRVVRSRSPEKIVAEMAHWQDVLGVSMFVFRDPVFSINRKHTMALCDAIERSGRKFKFIVETHLKNLDEELVRRLWSVGNVMIKCGVESASLPVMKDAKRFTIEADDQVQRIRMIEQIGPQVTSMFIFGFPTDTEESCRATIDYARRLNTIFAQFAVFTPYPGTPVFREYRDKVTANRYEDFTQYHLVFRHQSLSARDIRRIMSKAYGDYFLRFGWLRKYLQARLALTVV